MTSSPIFRRYSLSGDLQLGNSVAAKVHLAKGVKGQCQARKAEIVHNKAIEAVREAGGDVNIRSQVLGHYTIELRKFFGQTFKWVVENSLGYAAYLVHEVQKEQLCKGVPLSENKHLFKEYLLSFPEGREALAMRDKRNKAKVEVGPKPSTRVQLSPDQIRKLYPPQEARSLIRTMSKQTRPTVHPNIRVLTSTVTSESPTKTSSDDELMRAAEELEAVAVPSTVKVVSQSTTSSMKSAEAL